MSQEVYGARTIRTGDYIHYQHLRTATNKWVELAEEQWQTLAKIFHKRTVAEQEHILFPGDYVHELLFVCSGLLRFYYLSEDGTESNKAFIAENSFAGSLSAAVLEMPVIYGVQTLGPSTLLVAKYSDFVGLFDEHPVFDRLGRKLAEWLLVRKELRTRNLLQHQAKERYLTFKQQFTSF